MFSSMKYLNLLLLITLFRFNYAEGCDLMDMVHSLQYLSSPETNCSVNVGCSSVKCTGTAEGKPFIAGLVFSVCDANPSVNIILHVPHLGIKDWSNTFYNTEEAKVSGFQYPINNSSNQSVSVSLAVGLQRTSQSNEFQFSLTLKGCSAAERMFPNCSLVRNIIQDKKLSFTCSRENTIVAKKCDISVPFTCDNDETCQQLEFSSEGICVSTNTTVPPSVVPVTEPSTSKRDAELLTVNIAVPLLVSTVVIALVVAAYRKGWIRKLRHWFEERSQFEHLSSNSQMNEDDDEPLPL